MNSLSFFSVIVFFACFAAVFFINSQAIQNNSNLFSFTPPYAENGVIGVFNAFFFVFVFSLLFFGFTAPVAMGVQGLVLASKYSYFIAGLNKNFSYWSFAFIIPQFFAVFAAVSLGEGVIKDYTGKGSVYEGWNEAIKFFSIGLAVLILMVLIQNFTRF
jgi:Mn2+/Fe2+ NRAMP family transporter